MKAEVGKRYRHYKGYEYTVIALARMEESLEEVVVYRAEYETDDFGEGAIWVRSRLLFEGKVNLNGKTIDRFSQIS